MTCLRCGGLGWVCENHHASPWDDNRHDGCECGAGMPCEDCNPCDRDNPPRLMPGMEIAVEAGK